jgi:hypothetical protein
VEVVAVVETVVEVPVLEAVAAAEAAQLWLGLNPLQVSQ